jgi:hypothetical protein
MHASHVFRRTIAKGNLAAFSAYLLLSTVSAALPQGAGAVTLPTCNGKTATIVGGVGNDTLNGTAGDDVIVDLNGSNHVNGNGGNDTICTGDGNDHISTGSGNDWIDAGDGNNQVDSGDGVNHIKAGSGNDNVDSGSGDDWIDAGNGNNQVDAGAGDDIIITGNGNDTIDGDTGTNYCAPGSGVNHVLHCTTTGGYGTVVITQDAVPNDAQDFAFTGGLGAFSLDDDTNATLPSTRTFLKPAGTYAVAQGIVALWPLTGLTCTGGGGNTTASLAGHSASVGLDNGETVTCTFTNTKTLAASSSSSAAPVSSSSSAAPVVSSSSSAAPVVSSSSSAAAVLPVVSILGYRNQASGTYDGTQPIRACGTTTASGFIAFEWQEVGTDPAQPLSYEYKIIAGPTAVGYTQVHTDTHHNGAIPVPGTYTVQITPTDAASHTGAPVTCTMTYDPNYVPPSSSSSSVSSSLPAAPASPLFWNEEDTTQVKIDWKAIPGATGYKIYRSADNVTFGAPVDAGNVLTYTDAVPTGGAFYYKVTAYNAGGESSLTADSKFAQTKDIVIDDNAMTADFNANGIFSKTGSWGAYDVNTAGAEQILSFVVGGDNYSVAGPFGSQTATWTTGSSLTGNYDVYVDYICDASRGNVSYDVYAGAVKLNASPIVIDQSKKSSDGTACGSQTDPASQPHWKLLGNFPFNGDTASVVLASASSSNVVADAAAFHKTGELACVPTDANLAAYWKFDEATGTVANDSAGVNDAGTLNGPTWTASVPPSLYANTAALSFDGANDYVSAGNAPSLSFATTDAFSGSAWINASSFSGYQTILHKIDDTNSARRGYLFTVENGTPEVWILSDFGANNYLRVNATAAVPAGSWHHVAFSYNGSGLASGVKIYLDGADVTGATAMDALAGSISNSKAFEIGYRSDAAAQPFSGLIDDVRVYGTVVTPSEIASLAGGMCVAGTSGSTNASNSSSSAAFNSESLSSSSSSVAGITICHLPNSESPQTITVDPVTAAQDILNGDLPYACGTFGEGSSSSGSPLGFAFTVCTHPGNQSLEVDASDLLGYLLNGASIGACPATSSSAGGSNSSGNTATSSSSSIASVTQCVASGLVAQWKLDENAGVTTADATGNGHTGTLEGLPSWSTGASAIVPNPSALTFNTVSGHTSDLVRATGTAFNLGTTDFTVSAFVKVSPGAADRSVLGHFDSVAGGYRGWGLYLYNTNRVNFFGYGNAGTNDTSFAASVLDNGWHHVTGVYKRSGTSLTIDTYVDGVLKGSNTAVVGDISAATDMLLGKYMLQQNFQGSLDDVRVYGRALTSTEITSLGNNCGNVGGSSSSAPATGSSSSASSFCVNVPNLPEGFPIAGLPICPTSSSSSSVAGNSSSGAGNTSSSGGSETGNSSSVSGGGGSTGGGSFQISAFTSGIDGQSGDHRGHRTTESFSKIFTIIGQNGTAPGGFGGGRVIPGGSFGGSKRVTDAQKQEICAIEKLFPPDATPDFINLMSNTYAFMSGLDASIVAQKLKDTSYCSDVNAALLPQKKNFVQADEPFYVDTDGFPVLQDNPFYNACIRQDLKKLSDPAFRKTNPDKDKHGIPYPCSQYHAAGIDGTGDEVWTLPGTPFFYAFNRDTHVTTLPAGHFLKVLEKVASL